jgi:hypothetical protein
MKNIQQRAMLVAFTSGLFSPTKQDKKVTKEVITNHHAAADAGKFIKQLLPKEALDKVREVRDRAGAYHRTVTFAWTDDGYRILPSDQYMTYMEKFRGFKKEFEDAVDEFMGKYEQYVEERRAALNGMYDPRDYPHPTKARKKFQLGVNTMPFPEGDDFRVDIPDHELEYLQRESQNKYSAALAATTENLWTRLAEPLRKMAELADPKTKVFDTVVSNLKEIVDLIPALNLTQDPNLQRIHAMCVNANLEVAPDEIRKDPDVRRETAEKANAILATMSAYLPVGDEEEPTPPLELPLTVPGRTTIAAPIEHELAVA